MANLKRIAATLLACALAYGAFTYSEPVAGLLGLNELQLVTRLGLTFLALGLGDVIAGKLLARARHDP